MCDLREATMQCEILGETEKTFIEIFQLLKQVYKDDALKSHIVLGIFNPI